MSSPRPIIVIGSINVDFVVRSRRMAAPGHTVAGTSFEITEGGKGANQAHAAATLGADVTFIGRVGDDHLGNDAIAALKRSGVKVSRIRRHQGEPTGVAFIQVDESGENAITIVPGANDHVTEADVDRVFADFAGRQPVVILGFEVPVVVAVAAAEHARAAGWTVILNPAPITDAPAELYRNVDVLVPNEHELAGIGDVDEVLRAGTGAIVITKGSKGAELHRHGNSAVIFPACAVEPVDTTGAGDAFIGTLAWALSRGDDLRSAITQASAGGAIATLTAGARSAHLTSGALQELLARSVLG